MGEDEHIEALQITDKFGNVIYKKERKESQNIRGPNFLKKGVASIKQYFEKGNEPEKSINRLFAPILNGDERLGGILLTLSDNAFVEEKNIQPICKENDLLEESYFDPFAMHQCLLNLVSNAIDAIPSDKEGLITIEVSQDERKNLVLSVSDNGIGISQENQEKIFKGMFGTKGSKETGLGLLVVQKIVKEHQGILEIDSKEGAGTNFTIKIEGEGWARYHIRASFRKRKAQV